MAVTTLVSVLHTIFDALAFKSDVGFWRANKSMEGLSARTVVFNAACQLVVFLYLLDNDTSWMVVASSGMGLAIECWKVTKSTAPRLVSISKGLVRFEPKRGYDKNDTARHDAEAMRYLSYVLYPALLAFAAYSLMYNEHAGWYSFVLDTLVSFVYAFGFVAMLGAMSLSGMMMKNAIVLIDEIELQKSEGLEPKEAILNAGVSRLRPVSMAALTTALGMIPLLFDAFFVAMAVTIIAGLVVATVLTMVIVPVLYSIFFRVSSS